MPLFHVGSDGLVPFRRLAGSATSPQELEESLAAALWCDLGTALGEDLFEVHNGTAASSEAPRGFAARNAKMGSALVALDQHANVVVICVRQIFDHGSLAACLESVGWARNVTISELAELYWQGRDTFWRSWQEFVGASGAPSISRKPRLIVIASEVASASRSALDFLLDHELPVQVLRASLFSGPSGNRILEVQSGGRGSGEQLSRPRSASSSRSDEANRTPAIPRFTELGTSRGGERRQGDLPPFDGGHSKANPSEAPPASSRTGTFSTSSPLPARPVKAHEDFQARAVPSAKSSAEPRHSVAPAASEKKEEERERGAQPSIPSRPHTEAPQRPEPTGHHAQDDDEQPRKLDPLADTLIRVQAANKARLTGSPAIEDDEPQAPLQGPAPAPLGRSHRAPAGNDEPETERPHTVDRPRPHPGREAQEPQGPPAEQPAFAANGPGSLGGFLGAESGELHMVANGTAPRYRASDMGELPPPDWD